MHKDYKKTLALTIAIISMSGISAYAKPHNQYQKTYGALLTKHVIIGKRDRIKAALVDYNGWAKDKNHIKAMRKLQQTNPAILIGKEKMAFWINAYNLLTIDLIIKTGEKESIRNQGGIFLNVWKSHSWKISNKSYTLDQIEHEILRKMGEARIHFAINCASLSCPDLLKRPYKAEILDQQLQNQTRNFIHNPKKGVRITSSGIRISKIFGWFEDDFGGEKNIIKLIKSYRSATKNTTEIQGYLDYNWNLNCQKCFAN